MLPLLLLLPAVFMNTTGAVLFDGNAIAYVHLNGTSASVALPLLPGEHMVQYGSNSMNYSLFDVSCVAEGTFSCNVTAYGDASLPFDVSCGKKVSGTLKMQKGESKIITAGSDCDKAELKIGDYRQEYEFTRVFVNYITLESEQKVNVYQEGHLILEKFGNEYVGFSELEPGEYKVSAGQVKGKLLVKPAKNAAYGFMFSAFLVIAAVALLWLG